MQRMLVIAVFSAALAAQVSAQTGGGGGSSVRATAQVVTPASEAGTQVPIKRIVLFSSGVGFFEHSGTVSGNTSTVLMFKTDQINDILKSLLLSDAEGSAVRSVSYPSQDPLSKTLRSFQIDISGNPTMADMLNQIRGAKVKVTLGDQTVQGTVLGVEQTQRSVGNPEKLENVWQLNIVTGSGIQSVKLQEVKRIELEDPTLQKELQQALEALAQVRDKDKKPISIQFEGRGDRPVSIGYVVETPVWKTSYRLLLPQAGESGPARLQGWAIIENQTENDWSGVDLTLIGGRPLSFIENLYQPLYIPRPVENPKTYASLRPQTYAEGLASADADMMALVPQGGASVGARGGRGGGRGRAGGGAFGAAASAATVPPAMMMEGGAALDNFSSRYAPAQAADYSSSIASVASQKIGELFKYQIPNVSLRRQSSALMPIVSDAVEFDRVSIFNSSVLPRNPLLGVRLKNTTGNYLLGGPLTVLNSVAGQEAVYAGDARIDDASIGAERLLSYGIDQETLVDAGKTTQTQRIAAASIVKGVMVLRRQTDLAQAFVIQNKSDHEKTVVIEDPINAPYELMEPAKPLEKTDSIYRFQTAVPAGKTGVFTVKKRQVNGESVQLLSLDPGPLLEYRQNGEIPARIKDALVEIARRKQAMTEIQRKIDQKNADRARILEEETHIRANIPVLPEGSQSRNEQIKALTDHEKELGETDKDIQDLQKQLEAAQNALEQFLGDLNIAANSLG